MAFMRLRVLLAKRQRHPWVFLPESLLHSSLPLPSCGTQLALDGHSSTLPLGALSVPLHVKHNRCNDMQNGPSWQSAADWRVPSILWKKKRIISIETSFIGWYKKRALWRASQRLPWDSLAVRVLCSVRLAVAQCKCSVESVYTQEWSITWYRYTDNLELQYNNHCSFFLLYKSYRTCHFSFSWILLHSQHESAFA